MQNALYRKTFSLDGHIRLLPSNPSSVEEKSKTRTRRRLRSRDDTRTCLATASLSGTEKKGMSKNSDPDQGEFRRFRETVLEPGDSPARDAVGHNTRVRSVCIAIAVGSDTSRYSVPSGGRGRGTAVSSRRRLSPPQQCGLLTPKPV